MGTILGIILILAVTLILATLILLARIAKYEYDKSQEDTYELSMLQQLRYPNLKKGKK